MSICEEIIREIYRLVREEGYNPNLSGMQEIRFSPDGYCELLTDPEVFRHVALGREEDNFRGVPIKIDGRQKVKFRVICKPTDD